MIQAYIHDHNLNLPTWIEDGFVFVYNPQLEELVPGINDLCKELLAEWDGFEFTEIPTSPWMTAATGPTDGIDWHNEGINEDDYSLVYALNDSSAALEVDDQIFEHKRGRTVVFKSSTYHKVQPTEEGTRYALAFLMHRREDG
jgi:hypothetical protein